MRIAELPDGIRLEFPDDTTDEVMDRVVKTHLAPQPQETPKQTNAERRAAIGGGRLRPFGFDTGIDMPQGVTEFLAGAGRRFADIGTLGNRPLRDEGADKLLDTSTPATLGGVTADLSTLVGGGAAVRALGTVPKLMSAAPNVANAVRTVGQQMVAPTSVRNAATTAGLYAAATQDGDIGNRATSGVMSAGAGALGQAIPSVLGAAIKPRLSADAQAMANANIRLTPGQMMGGAANQAEQKLMSVPVIGGMIRNARMRSIEDFNKSVANEVLAPLGEKATKPAGRELVREVQQTVSQAYDDVLPKIRTTFNDSLDGAIDTGKTLAATAGQETRFDAILKQDFYGKFTDASGGIAGNTLKEVDSGLATSARAARSKGDTELARAVEGVRMALRSTAQGAPEDLAKLKAADASYARLVRMENAAGMRGAKDGVFSPANFGNATERGASRSQKAAGTELMGKYADTAERTLSTNFPNSGTADRLLLGGGLLGAGYAAGVPPEYLALGGLGAAAYSRPGQAAIRGLMSQRPAWMEPIGNTARRLAPVGGLLGPQLLPVYSGK